MTTHGYFAEVRKRASPDLAAALDEPPLRTAWIPLEVLEEVVTLLARQAGPKELRAMGRDTTRDAVLPALRPILEGVLRLMDATPAALYARLNTMNAMVMPAVEATYSTINDRAGFVSLHYPIALSDPSLDVWVGVLEVAGALCSLPTRVSALPRPAGPRTARFAVEW